ncbi:YggT family protein, partial [Burkholderia multivorans]
VLLIGIQIIASFLFGLSRSGV